MLTPEHNSISGVAPGAPRPVSEKNSNFYLGFLFLPRPKREALKTVYGFCRTVDDIADSGAYSPQEAAKFLDFWRGEIGKLYEGNPTQDLSRKLLPVVREYHLPREGFEELLRGVGMDLEQKRYETFAELESYMRGVAGAVGLLCVEIFGYKYTPASDIRSYALTMGNAFQLTNILRDLGTDLERGRIYIPLEDLRSAGYTLETFLRREYTPAFTVLMKRQHERAKELYHKAKNLLDSRDRPSMAAAEVMAQIYEGLLDELEKLDFRVFFRRVSLPAWRKAALAFRAWLSCNGIY